MGPRDLEGSDRLVARTLEIIRYFDVLYAIENPGSGLLAGRDVVAGLPYKAVTYCKYADDDFPKYKKLTYIWTNMDWTPRPVCCHSSPCNHMVDGRHPMSAQRGPSRVGGLVRTGDRCSQMTLYSTPPALCDELAEACLINHAIR